LKQQPPKLILKTWDKEQLPTQCNERIICPIYMCVCETLKCNNHRQITLVMHIKYLLYY